MIKTTLETPEQIMEFNEFPICDCCKKQIGDTLGLRPVTINGIQYVRSLCGQACYLMDTFKSELEMEMDITNE